MKAKSALEPLGARNSPWLSATPLDGGVWPLNPEPDTCPTQGLHGFLCSPSTVPPYQDLSLHPWLITDEVAFL